MNDRPAAYAVSVLLLWLTACGAPQTSEAPEAQGPGRAPGAPAATGADPAMLERGRTLFEDWQCSLCHGEAREGNELGPPLQELERHWDVETLAAYLLDPERVATSDARLIEIAEGYPDSQMPAFEFPEDERRAVAAWLVAGAPEP